MAHDEHSNLYDLTRAELAAQLAAWGFSPVHAARLWNYLYWECAGSWDAMPELPAKVRTRLAAECALAGLSVAHELHSRDGFTRKFLLGLADGRRIETVLMRFTGRATACVSSQVGCAMGCEFCATGQMGFQRHLTAGEIVAQAVHLQRLLREERPASPSGHHDSESETRNPELETLNPEPGTLSSELLTVKVRYKEPGGSVSQRLEFPLTDRGTTWAEASDDFKFAASVASFGMILRESPYKGTATLAAVAEWARQGLGSDAGGQRNEFLGLVQRAQTIVQ